MSISKSKDKIISPSVVRSDKNTTVSNNQFGSGVPMNVKIKKNQILSLTDDDIQRTIELKVSKLII